ncbi:MAG: MmgE/PrpD family protein [Deltaproteobacteria bacterium]|nr:MmgE/PrpD family protein [Deltaproteobacteria bacterium]
MEAGHTIRLSGYCSAIRLEDLAPEVGEHVKYLLLDFIGLAAKGRIMASTKMVHKMVEKIGGSGAGTVIATPLKPLPQYAALANAASSHCMSLDDIYTRASIHPGSAIFAAALAASERAGVSGTRFMEGVVAGYETTLRVADAVNSKSHYAVGWHPTATCGTFGATAAVCRIFGLDGKTTASALGIAGSMSSGLMAFMQDGSWTKRIHPGLAAQRGIQAAQLAAEGFKGPEAVLEGKWGFLAATSREPNSTFLVQGLGQKPRVMDTGLKVHACCRYNQSAIDAAIDIMNKNDLASQMVETVLVETFKAAYPLVVEPWEEKTNPKTDVQAQFSLPYTVAVAIVKRKVGFEAFSSQTLHDPVVRDIIKRVTVKHEPRFDPQFPISWPARVTIRTSDGRTLSRQVDYPKGDVENPLTWEELVLRFRSHCKGVFEPSKQEQIVDAVKHLESVKPISQLTALLGK